LKKYIFYDNSKSFLRKYLENNWFRRVRVRSTIADKCKRFRYWFFVWKNLFFITQINYFIWSFFPPVGSSLIVSRQKVSSLQFRPFAILPSKNRIHECTQTLVFGSTEKKQNIYRTQKKYISISNVTFILEPTAFISTTLRKDL